MKVAAVVERVERVAATRVDVAVGRVGLEGALVDVRVVRSWLDAAEADLVRSLAEQVSFPESTLADTSKGSLGQAGKTIDRSKTLDAVPDFAQALDDGQVTAGHVDAITRGGEQLDDGQRAEFHDRVGGLVGQAAGDSVERFGRRVRDLVKDIERDDGMERLERQRRATSLRTWTDGEGMWNLRGKFDPLTALSLSKRLDDTVEALFAKATPDTCPSDPLAKQAHLRALALAEMMTSDGRGRPRDPEFVVVIDADAATSTGEPTTEFSIPVEVPWRVLAELSPDTGTHAVIVRNGVVLHAPGDLNVGRTTRLANRAQRRALRGLYRSCAIPGCEVGFDRCELHHVIWWLLGGRTDLDNLVPLCVRHHHKVHDDGWHLDLGANRELTVTFPDGTIHNTGPPSRRAA